MRGLEQNEIGICKECQEIEDKIKKEEEFNKAVEKRVQIEITKLTKKIETFSIIDFNGKMKKYTGYWERTNISFS